MSEFKANMLFLMPSSIIWSLQHVNSVNEVHNFYRCQAKFCLIRPDIQMKQHRLLFTEPISVSIGPILVKTKTEDVLS